jgi:hypothetical protein
MKTTFLNALIVLITLSSTAQTAFKDALWLAETYRQRGSDLRFLANARPPDRNKLLRDSFMEVLRRHYVDEFSDISDSINNYVLSSYRDNVFFEKYNFPIGFNAEAMEVKFLDEEFEDNSERVQNNSATVRPASGLNVAMLADGVAKFLVKRTKEELNIAFFDEFRQVLSENQNLGVLFPASRIILMGIGDQVYNYNTYLNSMRDAFISDLKRLHDNLETLMVQMDKSVLQDSMPVYYLADLFKVSRMLINQSPVNEVISYLGNDANFQVLQAGNNSKEFQKFKAATKLLFIISESVRAPEGQRSYIAPADFTQLIRDKTALDFYMGFIYEKLKNLDTLGLNFRDSLNYGKVDKIVNSVSAMVTLGDRLNDIRFNLDSGKYLTFDSLSYFQYFDYLKLALDILQTTRSFTATLFPNDIALLRELDRVHFVTSRISNIALDTRRKHYATAIINSGLLVNQLLIQSENLSCHLMRYGAFVASIAESRSSDEVAVVIESFALPRGSAIIKKHYPFNMCIGSYVGLNTSLEILDNLDSEDKTGWSIGVSAPIGIAFSWPLQNKKGKSPGSFSIFMSVLDLGAFTAYRFTNNETVKELPELRMDNLFAPGGAMVFGFPKFPGAFSVFMQRGPSLRKVTSDAYTFNETTGWKIGISLSVDIPLFNLYTKGKMSKCSQYK